MPSEKRLRQREGRQARQEELRRAQQQARKRRQYIIAAVVLVLFGAVFYFATRGSGTSKKVATSTTTAPGPAPAGVACPKLDGTAPRYTKFQQVPNCIDPAKTYVATLQTDAGNVVITLNAKLAPKTVNNFVFLSAYHFYDGTTFHRVITGFVDQGGDPTGTSTGGPGYTFADELPPKPTDYQPGGVAMANSGPNTNGSQFYILVGPTSAEQLLGGAGGVAKYSLFGQVTGGMDVATKINNDGSAAGTPTVVHKVVKATIAVT